MTDFPTLPILPSSAQPAPTGVVYVHEVKDWFRPRTAQPVRVVDWRPGLCVYELVPDGWAPDGLSILVGTRNAGLWDEVREGDHVLVINAPGVEFALLTGLEALLLSAALSAGIAFLASKLVSSPPDERDLRDDRTPYGFGAVQLNYDPNGFPIPLLYGRQRVGGLVISSRREVIAGDPPTTFLYLLIMIGSGPIEGVGQYTSDQDGLSGSNLPDGMEINGNSAVNYDDVEISIRTGTPGQEVIPGFETNVVELIVDLPIEQVKQNEGPPITDWSLAAVFDFPVGVTAEQATVTLSFPEGLYDINSSGVVQSESLDVQIRHIELDEFGTPVGPYVDVNFLGQDFTTVTAAINSPFLEQIKFPIVDPELVVDPEPTNRCRFNPIGSGTNERGSSPLPFLLAPEWEPDAEVEEFTFYCVLRAPVGGPIGRQNPVVAIADYNPQVDDTIKGIYIHLPVQTAFGYDIRVVWGDGTGTVEGVDWDQITFASGIPPNQLATFTITWKRNLPASEYIVSIYGFAGAPLDEKPTNVKFIFPSAATTVRWGVTPGYEATNDISFHLNNIALEECKILKRAIDGAEVAFLWNDGTVFEGLPTERELVFGSHWNEAEPSLVSALATPGYQPAEGSIDWFPPTVTPVEPGEVLTNPSTPTRDVRLRVEVQTLQNEATAADRRNTVRFESVIAETFDEVAHVGRALIGARIRASDQLSGSRPNMTWLVKGRSDLPVWDGNDPENPTFVLQYSDLPAWQVAHLLLNRRNGGGAFFNTKSIDWESFLANANFAEAKAWDQKGRFTATELAYSSSETGFSGPVYKITLSKPVPGHFVEGMFVRVKDVLDTDYPEGIFEVKLLDRTSSPTTYSLWTDWPLPAAPTTNPFTNPNAATVEGQRQLISSNIQFADRGTKFWDAVNMLTSVARSAPVRLGDVISLKIEEPRPPVHTFGPQNMVLGSFRVSTARRGESFNKALGEINDEDLNYERNSIARSDPSLKGGVASNVVKPKTFDMRGTTNPAQARVELDFLLALNQGDKFFVEFDTAVDGIFVRPGDVFACAFPVPAPEYGGRCLADGTEPNLLSEPEDFSTWDINANAEIAVQTATPDPFALDGFWYEVGTIAGAGSFALYRLVSGVFGIEGENQIARFHVKNITATNFRIRIRDDDTPTNHGVTFDWIGGVPVESSQQGGPISSNVTDLGGGVYDVEVVYASQAGDVGNVRTVYFDVQPDGPFNGLRMEIIYAGLYDTAETTSPPWARAQGIQTDIPVTIEAGSTYGLACRQDETDAVGVAEVDAVPPGTYPAGSFIPLNTPLGFVPKAGAPWISGPSELMTSLFQAISAGPKQDLTVHIVGFSYSDDDYPDPDAIDVFADSLQITVEDDGSNDPNVLPPPPIGVTVREEPIRDPNTGTLRKTIWVSWRNDLSGYDQIAASNVWLGEKGGPQRMIGTVRGAATSYRIPEDYVEAGRTYVVTIQQVNRAGTARGLKGSGQAEFLSRWPYRAPSVPKLKISRAGDALAYFFELEEYEPNARLELRRGGFFMGQIVADLPATEIQYGPNLDWVLLDEASDGRGSPPLYLSVVLPNGVRGGAVELREDPVLVNEGEKLGAEAIEEVGWSTPFPSSTISPALTDCQIVLDPVPIGSPQPLGFDGSALEFTYESANEVLDEARRVHVSFSIEAIQLHPITVEEWGWAVDDPRYETWNVEGPTDPNDPAYGVCTTRFEWQFSETDVLPAEYEAFRPGSVWLRSSRWKLTVQRPSDEWDVRITRASFRMVELTPQRINGGVR